MERERPTKWTAESGPKPQINVISNRELQVLESPLTHRKQRTTPGYNRELSTIWSCGFSCLRVTRTCTVPLPTFLSCALLALLIFAVVTATPLAAQEKRKVIIDEDCSGPGGTNTQAILALIQSPDTDVLGITIVDRRRVARRRSPTRFTPARDYRPHGHSGCSRRGFSSRKQQGIHRAVGNNLRQGLVSRRVELCQATSGPRVHGNSSHAGRCTDHQTVAAKPPRIFSYGWSINIRTK